MATTKGAHHIGLTVPDLMATRNFFVDTLGFQQVGEIPDSLGARSQAGETPAGSHRYPAIFVSDGTILLTLWRANNPDRATPFDRKNIIGLHHFALKVENLATLKALPQTLIDIPNVEIEFAPEPLGNDPAHHMMCYIPGGIRMEFIATAS